MGALCTTLGGFESNSNTFLLWWMNESIFGFMRPLQFVYKLCTFHTAYLKFQGLFFVESSERNWEVSNAFSCQDKERKTIIEKKLKKGFGLNEQFDFESKQNRPSGRGKEGWFLSCNLRFRRNGKNTNSLKLETSNNSNCMSSLSLKKAEREEWLKIVAWKGFRYIREIWVLIVFNSVRFK